MSIVIAKRDRNMLTMTADTASFVNDRKISDSAEKIFKINKNIIIGTTGNVNDISFFLERLRDRYDSEIIEQVNKEVDFEVEIAPEIPTEDELRGLCFAVYNSLREDKMIIGSSSLLISVGLDCYSFGMSKDEFSFWKLDEEVVYKGYAIGMYTENIETILEFLSPEDAIKYIHRNGGIFINGKTTQQTYTKGE